MMVVPSLKIYVEDTVTSSFGYHSFTIYYEET